MILGHLDSNKRIFSLFKNVVCVGGCIVIPCVRDLQRSEASSAYPGSGVTDGPSRPVVLGAKPKAFLCRRCQCSNCRPTLRSLLFTFSDDMQESDVSLFFYSWALKRNERKKKLNHGSVRAAKHRRSRCAELDLWERIHVRMNHLTLRCLQTSVPDKRHRCATVLRPSGLQIRL